MTIGLLERYAVRCGWLMKIPGEGKGGIQEGRWACGAFAATREATHVGGIEGRVRRMVVW